MQRTLILLSSVSNGQSSEPVAIVHKIKCGQFFPPFHIRFDCLLQLNADFSSEVKIKSHSFVLCSWVISVGEYKINLWQKENLLGSHISFRNKTNKQKSLQNLKGLFALWLDLKWSPKDNKCL